MKKNNFISLFMVLFFLMINPLFSDSKKGTKIRLQLNWKHQFQFAGYYAAKEKGYYEKEGLEVEILPLLNHNEKTVDIVLNKKAEFGIEGSDLIIEWNRGKNIVLLSPIYQHSSLVLISKKQTGMDSIHSIYENILSIENNTSELLVYLNKEGINIKKLNIVPYNYERFLKNKNYIISGHVSDELIIMEDNGISYNILNPRASGVDFYGDSIFTSKEYLKKNPKIIEKFLSASLMGWKYALENKGEISDIIIKKYSNEKSKSFLIKEATIIEKLISPELVDIGYINIDRWEKIAEEFKDAGLINETKDIKNFIYKNKIEFYYKTLRRGEIILALGLTMIFLIFNIVFLFNNKLHVEILEKNRLLDIVIGSEAELKELLTIIEHSPMSVVITDAEKKIRYANRAVFMVSGYSKEEIIGKNPNLFNAGDENKEVFTKLWEDISNGLEWHGEFKNKKKNGEIYWERAIIIPIKDKDDKIYSYLGIKEDITEKRKQLNLLKYHAERDSLTGIYNRRAGISILEEKSKNKNDDLIICFIDLNRLKHINDTFGHEYGDNMLKNFVELVNKELREKDIFFRFGGDEFLIIFSDCTEEISEKIWNRIKDSFDKVNREKSNKYEISASHGIIKFDETYKNIDEFIAAADKKMYEEKKIMKNIKY